MEQLINSTKAELLPVISHTQPHLLTIPKLRPPQRACIEVKKCRIAMRNIFADQAWFLSHAVLLSVSEMNEFFPGTKIVISIFFSWKCPLRCHKTSNNMATKRYRFPEH